MTNYDPHAKKATDGGVEQDQNQIDVRELSDERLEELRDEIANELTSRASESDVDLSDASSIDLTAGRWAKWKTLSAHANTKAVKPWILHVTGEHAKYGVDGDWLDKKTIDGAHHMDVSGLEAGDIIKVSGASHTNKKHRYYRVLSVTDETMHYEKISESETIEEVA